MEKPTFKGLERVNPQPIQEDDRYLPTAFDDSITIVEKINKLIYNMDELQAQTSVSMNELTMMYEEMYNEVIPREVAKYIEDITGSDMVGTIQEVSGARVGADAVSYSSLKARLDSEYNLTNQKLDALTTSYNTTKTIVDGMQPDVTQLITEVNSLDSRVTTLEVSGGGGGSEVDITALGIRVSSLEGVVPTKADKTTVDSMNGELQGVLETKTEVDNARVNSSDVQSANLKERLDTDYNTLLSGLNSVTTQVESVEPRVDDVEITVDSLQTDKANQTDLTALTTRVTTVEGEVATKANQSDLTVIENRVTPLETFKTDITYSTSMRVDLNNHLNEGWLSFGSSGSSIPRGYVTANKWCTLLGGFKLDVANGGVATSPAFTLPQNMRPLFSMSFITSGKTTGMLYEITITSGTGLITVKSMGSVEGDFTHVRLEGCSYPSV